jgi:crotonobetainyl-CoA:carnitine CoA-transferase CaiB-like acyl-CoA transferase
MPMPLEGTRVIEWTQWQQGPVAGVMLADLGADVIKIEERTGGDPARGLTGAAGSRFPSGKNAYWDFNNRGKRSITVNLREKRGREIVYQLIAKADIFLHNFRPSVVARNGMEYETLIQYNPKLIYVQASGWGLYGPEVDARSFDLLGQARSSFMVQCGDGDGPPSAAGGGISDQIGAIMAAFGAITALYVRDKFGLPQKVDASLLGSTMWLMGLGISFHLIGGLPTYRIARARASNPLWNYYKCQDGKWLVLGHLQSDRFWPNVCKAMGLEGLENDPKFANREARAANSAELVNIFDQAFASRPREEWLSILKENGCIAAPVNEIDDLVNDPQVIANEYLVDFDHPLFGRIKYPGIPVKFTKTPGSIRGGSPEFGQHTEEVLTELLGYSWEEITQLREQGII